MNVGSVDRVLRFVLGLVLLATPFVASVKASLGGWTWLLAAAGLVFLVTALTRFCPLYRLVGLSTCPVPGDRR